MLHAKTAGTLGKTTTIAHYGKTANIIYQNRWLLSPRTAVSSCTNSCLAMQEQLLHQEEQQEQMHHQKEQLPRHARTADHHNYSIMIKQPLPNARTAAS